MPDLSPLDDLPVHQAFAPLPEPSTSDPHFNDGYYFAAYAPGTHVFCGLRVHPNTNVMDGYGGAVHGGVQRDLRVSRALRPDPYPFTVGALSLEVLEPMVRQRLTLAPNPSGIAFALEFEAVSPPFMETTHVQYRHGRVHNHVLRYTQPARATGHVEIEGERLAVDGWHAARDHSWGMRATMGPYVPTGGIGAGSDPDRRAMRLWIPFECGDVSGFFHTHEAADGTPLDFEGRLHRADGSSAELVAVRHDLRYHDGDRLREGEITLVDARGGEHEYAIEVACAPAHPQGFGYVRGWEDGGQPGVYRGPAAAEHDRFDVGDPAILSGPDHVPVARRLGGTEFACTMRGADGSTGMGHVEHMLYPSHPRRR